jgi:hypothetical protein
MSERSAAILNRPIPHVSALTMITIATGASRIQRSRPARPPSRTKPNMARTSTG